MDRVNDMLPERGYVAVGVTDGGWIQGRPDGHVVMRGDDLGHYGLLLAATIQRWDGPVIVVDATRTIRSWTQSRRELSNSVPTFVLGNEGDGIELASDLLGAPSWEKAARSVAQSMERWCPDDMPVLGRNRSISTLSGMLCMLAGRGDDGIMSRVLDWAHTATLSSDNEPDADGDRGGRVREAMVHDVQRVGRFLGRLLDPAVNALLDGRSDRVLCKSHLTAAPATVYVEYPDDEAGLLVTAHAIDAMARWLRGAGKRALIVLHGLADLRAVEMAGELDGWDIVTRAMGLSPADATVIATATDPAVEATLLSDAPGVCVSVRGAGTGASWSGVVRRIGDDGGWIEHQATGIGEERVAAVKGVVSHS